jgi:hypothetical protein
MGWLQNSNVRFFSGNQADSDKPTITVFGMSHSVQLAEALGKLEGPFVVRSFGAPGAVASWSYAAYLFDRKVRHSDVVVLSVMTLGVPYICTTSGLTNNFEGAWPFSYPRFLLTDGLLKSVDPPFNTIQGYREYFRDPTKWNSYRRWLGQYDKYYDPLLFKSTLLDHSCIVRMMRRAYAHSMQRKISSAVYNEQTGFNLESEEVKLLFSIIRAFCDEARQDHSLPIIYIVNNLMTGDSLYRLLGPMLRAEEIPALSSHEICPPNDPSLYETNSHFIPSINRELAKALMEIVRTHLPGSRN